MTQPTLHLVALTGPEGGRRWACGDEPASLGRASDNVVQIHDEAVSKHHARIESRSGTPLLLDLKSRNGTYVDGVRVEDSVTLSDGVLVTLGNTILRCFVGGSAEMAAAAVSVAETVVHDAPAAESAVDWRERLDAWTERVVAVVSGGRATETVAECAGRVADALRAGLGADWLAVVRISRNPLRLEAVGLSTAEPTTEPGPVVSRTIVERVLRSGQGLLCEDQGGAAGAGIDARETAGSSGDGTQRRSVLCAAAKLGQTEYVVQAGRGPQQTRFEAGDLWLLESLVRVLMASRAGDAVGDVAAETGGALAGALVYRSRSMEQVITVVRRAAATSATILLLGESGTGKELLARLVHESSPRARKPLVRVNCASIHETLAESELFGHERGAFTGAVRQHQGRFEQAHTGTLLLDEIGELSPACQGKLLRVLEEGVIERVGGERPLEVDVRVVAATNRDLHQAVADGKFRADLLHRIAAFPVRIPPLRERAEDIPALVTHFVTLLARQHLQGSVRVLPEALEALEQYSWPGNVRQLRNVIEQALIRQNGDPLDRTAIAAALEFHQWADGGAMGAGSRPGKCTAQEQGHTGAATHVSLEDARRQFERQYVLRVMEEQKWNRTQAAKVLGIARQNLIQKLKKLEIGPPGE